MPALPEPNVRCTPPSSFQKSRGPSHRLSTPEVSDRCLKPRHEAEQSDASRWTHQRKEKVFVQVGKSA